MGSLSRAHLYKFVKVMHILYIQLQWSAKRNHFQIVELSVKSLEEGQICGFDPSWRKFSITSSLACRVLEPILKVGWNFWDLFFPPLNL